MNNEIGRIPIDLANIAISLALLHCIAFGSNCKTLGGRYR